MNDSPLYPAFSTSDIPSDASGADSDLAPGLRLVREVLEPMQRVFVGKEEIIDLLGVALVARENLFLLGPPGTAKSAIVRELARRIDGPSFDYLLTRFTEPNELFGPFDIRRLRDGDLVTNTEGMLPEAAFVFLDELLNANSAILNSLLMVLNERVFRRGKETLPLPLLLVVGASNHLPEDDALAALFDRFLVRVRCDNVGDESLSRVLEAGWNLERSAAEVPATLSVEAIRELQRAVEEVDLSAVRTAYRDLVVRLRAAGISISDRRAVKLQRLVAASALLCGRTKALPSDLWVVRTIWDRDEQREILSSLVGEVVESDDSAEARHPRSRVESAPDPEAVARSIEALEVEIEGRPEAPVGWRDRLGAVSERVQWIENATAREHLAERVQRLWNIVDGRS